MPNAAPPVHSFPLPSQKSLGGLIIDEDEDHGWGCGTRKGEAQRFSQIRAVADVKVQRRSFSKLGNISRTVKKLCS